MKPVSWKRRLIEGLKYSVPWKGLTRLPGPVVLMYHAVVARIQDPELDRWAITRSEFVRHLRFLKRSYEVISLSRAVEAVASGRALPNAVVLMFDDAFANVYRNARPLLRDHQMPYAVAVPAGLLGTCRTIWSLEVQLVLMRSSLSAVRLPVENGAKTFPLITRPQRLEATKEFLNALRTVPEATRQSHLDVLWNQLPAGQLERLLDEFGEFKLMSHDHLRELVAEGVTMAAHGFLHVPLGDWETAEVLEREIAVAKSTLEKIVNTTINFFVYTYGVSCPAAVQRARQGGYRAAFTTLHGYLSAGADLFHLRRIAAECNLAHLRLQFDNLAG